jgi:sugar O-acyltransferase (sialic acid O-acetyltransferase NeuD family)
MCNIIILGAGGHARVIADIVIRRGDKFLGFLEDNPAAEHVMGYPILGASADSVRLCREHNAKAVIGIGKSEIREKLAALYALPYYTAIHPAAVVAADAQIGAGTVIMANAVVNTGTVIGCHCVVNTLAGVDHDCAVGDFAHISPNAVLCGNVRIGKSTWICAGATVSNNITVCPGCVVGAGAVVVRDITEKGTYTGVPARRKSN